MQSLRSELLQDINFMIEKYELKLKDLGGVD